MHKLWPYSLKKQEQKETVLDQPKIEVKVKTTESISSEKDPSSHENKIETTDQIPEEKLPDNKTPMCMINELVRYNKVNSNLIIFSIFES